MIYRRRGDMCRGYSQSSLVGAKTATLLLPAHLESRLSGSAERLALSLLLSPHPSIHPSFLPQLLGALPNSHSPSPTQTLSTVCVAADSPLKLRIGSHFFRSPTHFPLPFSLSLLLLPSRSTSSMPDEAQNSQTKKEQSVTECMWKISQRQLLFLSL